MTKYEILYNEKLGDYTLETEIKKVKSIKKIPMKFKMKDSTAKFRKELLRKQILKN